jgi:alcohol dehydrogenase
MKAARIDAYGHASVIKIVDIDQPPVAERHILVRAEGSSINPYDSLLREGLLEKYIPLKLPITLGSDIAGTVQLIGKGAAGFKVGDKVYGQASVAQGASGAFAEFVATSANQLAHQPSGLNSVEAGSMPLAGVSALQAINGHIQLQPGERILIHGGSGGIGSIAIQIAKFIGAHVATTATGKGLEYVKKLGADEVIDHKVQAFDELLHDYDAVLDTVAGDTYTRSFKVVRKDGIIVTMNAKPNDELMARHGVIVVAQQTQMTTDKLDQLRELIEAGIVTPHVHAVFPLSDIQQAFVTYESGQVISKVGIEI